MESHVRLTAVLYPTLPTRVSSMVVCLATESTDQDIPVVRAIILMSKSERVTTLRLKVNHGASKGTIHRSLVMMRGVYHMMSYRCPLVQTFRNKSMRSPQG